MSVRKVFSGKQWPGAANGLRWRGRDRAQYSCIRKHGTLAPSELIAGPLEDYIVRPPTKSITTSTRFETAKGSIMPHSARAKLGRLDPTCHFTSTVKTEGTMPDAYQPDSIMADAFQFIASSPLGGVQCLMALSTRLNVSFPLADTSLLWQVAQSPENRTNRSSFIMIRSDGDPAARIRIAAPSAQPTRTSDRVGSSIDVWPTVTLSCSEPQRPLKSASSMHWPMMSASDEFERLASVTSLVVQAVLQGMTFDSIRSVSAYLAEAVLRRLSLVAQPWVLSSVDVDISSDDFKGNVGSSAFWNDGRISASHIDSSTAFDTCLGREDGQEGDSVAEGHGLSLKALSMVRDLSPDNSASKSPSAAHDQHILNGDESKHGLKRGCNNVSNAKLGQFSFVSEMLADDGSELACKMTGAHRTMRVSSKPIRSLTINEKTSMAAYRYSLNWRKPGTAPPEPYNISIQESVKRAIDTSPELGIRYLTHVRETLASSLPGNPDVYFAILDRAVNAAIEIVVLPEHGPRNITDPATANVSMELNLASNRPFPVDQGHAMTFRARIKLYGRMLHDSSDDKTGADVLARGVSTMESVRRIINTVCASAEAQSAAAPHLRALFANEIHDKLELSGVFMDLRSVVVQLHGEEGSSRSDASRAPGVYVALGSNVGDKCEAIERACKAIDEDPDMHIVRTSSLYETEPMYVEDQAPFLNGACEIFTRLAPMELLRRLQGLEKQLGRVKTIDKGPRNIDLDILLYRNEAINVPDLVIPHAQMTERQFVLRPLADICPKREVRHTKSTGTIDRLLKQVAQAEAPIWPVTPLGPLEQSITALNPKRSTRIMSILNTTPDSFSDGGDHLTMDAQRLRDIIASQIAAGANIIDIGGQSSRPNAPDVSSEDEIARILPAIEAFRSLPNETTKDVAISIDTYRASVAEAAINAGAHIINDISAGLLDAQMLHTVARLGCTYVMMHMRGTPATMQNPENTAYERTGGLIPTIATELEDRVAAAQRAGIRRWRIILDPGIGFAKTAEQNVEVLRRLPGLIKSSRALQGIPWLVGTSRKGFIGKITGESEPKDRVLGTAATVAAAVAGGADVVRVHDVEAMTKVVRMSDALYRH